MLFFPDQPLTLRDATTVISRYPDRKDWVESRWLYYFQPVYHFLAVRGVPEDKRWDMAMDLMIKLESVMQRYDPSLGGFRPFLGRVLRNYYIDHLRCEQRHAVLPLDDACERLPGAAPPSHEEEEVENAAMMHYLFMAFYYFEEHVLAGPSGGKALERPLRVLHLLLLERRSQVQVASDLGISERQVRTDTTLAAEALVEWIRAWVTEEDLDDLAEFARRKNIDFDFSLAEVAGLFRHLCPQKMNIIYLLLVVASRKPGASAASVSAVGAARATPTPAPAVLHTA